MGLMLTPCGKIPIDVSVMGTVQGVTESPAKPNWMVAIDSCRGRSAALSDQFSAVQRASSGPPPLFGRASFLKRL